MTDAPRWLDTALQLTSSDRQRDYGRPLLNFLRIAIAWTLQLSPVLKPNAIVHPLHVARLMIEMKMARDMNTFKDDNWIDTMGYAAVVDDMDRHLKELGYEKGVKAFDTMTLGELYALLVKLS